MWNLLLKGGVLIWPIVACSLISGAIILEKLVYLHRVRENDPGGVDTVRDLVVHGNERAALERCGNLRGPVARLMREAIAHRRRSPAEREEILSQVGQEELELLERHVSALGIIGHIAPLLGLLGTVVGMIRVFISVEQVGGPVDPGMLAGGIWEALITTAAGLAVAIPTMVFYHYLEGRIHRIYQRMQLVPLHLMGGMTARRDDCHEEGRRQAMTREQNTE